MGRSGRFDTIRRARAHANLIGTPESPSLVVANIQTLSGKLAPNLPCRSAQREAHPSAPQPLAHENYTPTQWASEQ